MSDVDLEAIDTAIRHTIADSGVLEDTLSLASQFSVPHDQVVRVVKSLEATDTVAAEVITTKTLAATPLGARVASDNISPEHAVASLVPYGADPGTPNAQLQAAPECAGSDGYRVCMKNGWLKAVRRPDLAPAPPAAEADAADADAADADADKGKKKKKEKDNVPVFVVRVVEDIGEDVVAAQMKAVVEGGAGAVDAAALKDLKKRKFVAEKTVKSFKLVAGPTFSRERKTLETDLTPEMLQSGAWRDAAFKPYNFKAMGRLGNVGHLHPLMKVRAAYRQVFLEMGYEEMPTDNFVESSFWNFDTLFQPQQHPARDAHDTFFVASPPPLKAPEDYIARVSDMHSKGGDGSIGWRYDWSREEASKTIMRTHTTAVSSRLLYKLAQEGFKPSKYFSIDRVFRNETPDATHLAEFHQIEGVVCDRNLSLADLIGTTKAFFERIGMTNLRFKPAYNPYTEPSMEIFAYHPELKKWTEVGNSGIFRPEMLRPMGLPEDVSCIAWGISLERPTMIRYGIPNIRALIGAKVDLGFVRGAPMFRL